MHYVQQPQVLYIGGVKALNLETCLSVGFSLVSKFELNYLVFMLTHFF